MESTPLPDGAQPGAGPLARGGAKFCGVSGTSLPQSGLAVGLGPNSISGGDSGVFSDFRELALPNRAISCLALPDPADVKEGPRGRVEHRGPNTRLGLNSDLTRI